MKAATKGRVPLSTRERRVLNLIVEAKTNREIAAALGISPSTVKRHLENILRKLHVKNRVEAAVFAVRMGDCPSGMIQVKKAA